MKKEQEKGDCWLSNFFDYFGMRLFESIDTAETKQVGWFPLNEARHEQ